MKRNNLTAVLLLTAVLAASLSACGETADPSIAPTETKPAPAETEAVETEEPRIPSGLPDTDLGGYVLTMYQASDFFNEEGLYAEEANGDSINDAVYARNLGIMEKYNCVLAEETSDDRYVMDRLKPFILAGDDTIDVIYECGNSVIGNTQLFLDLADLSHLDFSKPWWSAEFNEGVTINGHLYFTLGAHMISAKESMIGTLFNKEIAVNYDINPSDLYDAARNGKWTLDMLGSYAKMAAQDINGDGVMDEKDRWGIIGENYDCWSLALGSGFKCVTKDSNGDFVYSFGSEKNINIMDKIMGITNDPTICLFAQQMKTSDVWATRTEMMANGQFLFNFTSLGNSMRDYKYDFGFLPIPKFDESQSQYYHDGSLGNNRLMVVPKTTSDPDTTAFLIEAMAYASYYELLPVYYQEFLNTKVLRDEESVEMLQIVQGTIHYDCGALFNWGNMRDTIENLAAAGSNTLASTAAKNESKTMKAIEKTLKTLEENE
ncbi:MAG: hypothetical protein MJ175_03705 [Clostridia bacterium]|nr:hypothetical protein [Clostridia bacterium]